MPAVWVVLPVSIPKTGEHSVGVSRHFSPDSDKSVHTATPNGEAIREIGALIQERIK